MFSLNSRSQIEGSWSLSFSDKGLETCDNAELNCKICSEDGVLNLKRELRRCFVFSRFRGKRKVKGEKNEERL